MKQKYKKKIAAFNAMAARVNCSTVEQFAASIGAQAIGKRTLQKYRLYLVEEGIVKDVIWADSTANSFLNSQCKWNGCVDECYVNTSEPWEMHQFCFGHQSMIRMVLDGAKSYVGFRQR